MNSGHGMEMKKDQAFSLVPEKHLLKEVEVTYVSIYVSKRSFSPAWIFDGAANAISRRRVQVNQSLRMTLLRKLSQRLKVFPQKRGY